MDLARSPLTVAELARSAIVTYVEKGVPLADACAALGISRSTFTKWHGLGIREVERCLKEGVDPEPHLAPYIEFVEDLELAHSKGIVRQIERVDRMAEGDWKAASWILQRMDQRAFLWTNEPKTDPRDERVELPDTTEAVDLLTKRLDEIAARRQKAIDVISRPIEADARS